MTPRRQAALRSRAGLSAGTGRDVPWPLPYRGLLDAAKSAEIRGLFAAEFENLWSDGVRITTRPGYAWGEDAARPLDRIPFEFGLTPHHLEIYADRLVGRVSPFTWATTSPLMSAQLSSRILLAGGGRIPLLYDGATPGEAGFSVATGINLNTFVGVVAHHDRPYFWAADKLEFYYGASVGAITGPLTRFPLDRLGNITGTIACMGSWTVDARASTDDLLVIVTTTGDVVAYRGLDPGDPNDWSIVGRFRCARPMSRFSILSWGGDLYLWTVGGIVSMRSLFGRGEKALTETLTEPVRDVFASLRASAATPDLWRLAADPAGRYLVATINEPTGVLHYAFGFEARAWALWTGIPARTWSGLGGTLQFTGLDGRRGVMAAPGKAAIGDDGDPIRWRYGSSWVSLSRNAALLSLTPTLRGTGPMDLDLWALADHRDSAADVAAAWQAARLGSEDAAHALSEVIPIGLSGDTFSVRLSGAATFAEVARLQARIGA